MALGTARRWSRHTACVAEHDVVTAIYLSAMVSEGPPERTLSGVGHCFRQAGLRCNMIFFTTFVTLIRRQLEGTERRLGSPARVEGNTLRLPIGTDVQVDDYVEHRPLNDEPRLLTVIDVIHPYQRDASAGDDHIEVTCVPSGRASIPEVTAPTLHPTMSTALALLGSGRMSEAVLEALRLVEERVRFLTANDDSKIAQAAPMFSARPPQLDITTTTGSSTEDECRSVQLLFIGAMLGLRRPHSTDTVDETLEYLALASMLMRRLDRAQSKQGSE